MRDLKRNENKKLWPLRTPKHERAISDRKQNINHGTAAGAPSQIHRITRKRKRRQHEKHKLQTNTNPTQTCERKRDDVKENSITFKLKKPAL